MTSPQGELTRYETANANYCQIQEKTKQETKEERTNKEITEEIKSGRNRS
jgi:CHASE3 domain sensor protein